MTEEIRNKDEYIEELELSNKELLEAMKKMGQWLEDDRVVIPYQILKKYNNAIKEAEGR